MHLQSFIADVLMMAKNSNRILQPEFSFLNGSVFGEKVTCVA